MSLSKRQGRAARHCVTVSFLQDRSGMIRRIPRRQTGLGTRRAERLAGSKAKGGAKGGRGCVGVYGVYRAGCRRCHITRRSKRRGSRGGPRSRSPRVVVDERKRVQEGRSRTAAARVGLDAGSAARNRRRSRRRISSSG